MRLAECFNEKTEDEWKAVGRRLTQCEMMQHQQQMFLLQACVLYVQQNCKTAVPSLCLFMFAVFVHVCCVYEHLCVFVFLLVLINVCGPCSPDSYSCLCTTNWLF